MRQKKQRPTLSVRQWMEARQLTQRAATKLLGCSRGALIKWERGEHRTPAYITLAIKALEDGHTAD